MRKFFKTKPILIIIGSIFLGDFATKMIPWLPANVSLILGIICFAIVGYIYLVEKRKILEEDLTPDEFKEINIKELSRWAEGWEKIYTHLNKIVLYAHAPQSVPRYQLYFEFDVFSKEGETQFEAFNQGTWDYDHFPVHNDIEKFKDMYNEKPKDSNYIDEWNFFCNAREADTTTPEGVPSIVIYKKKPTP